MENSRLVDPHGSVLLAFGNPLSLRVVEAIPLMGAWARPRDVLFDQDGGVWGDASGNAVGDPGVYVHRVLSAGRVRNTRMLG